jgi:hypothetical protein
MMPGDPRQIWETEADRRAEREIAEAAARYWGVEAEPRKLPKLYCFDFALERGRDFVTFLEAKDRPGLNYGFGDGYYIALSKIINAQTFRDACGLPVLLVVRFSNGAIHWTRLHDGVTRVVWAGRRDRPEDPLAMEPHGVIPWEMFAPIKILRVTIAPKDAADGARIVNDIGRLLKGAP